MTETTQNQDTPQSEVVGNDKVVSFHYRLCEVDAQGGHGDWLEGSFGRKPLKYLHGFHNVIVGLEKAMEGKQVGETVNITLAPDQAYGPRMPDSIRRIPIRHVYLQRGQKRIVPGMIVSLKTERGYKQVIAVKVGKYNVDVDFNHPLSGRTLYYEVQIVEIRDATAEELAHGHVHGEGGHQH